MEKAADLRNRREESRCDVDTAEVAGSEHKDTGMAGPKCCNFERSIPESLILCQDYPALRTDDTKPDPVLLIAVEMIVMNLHD